jgi:hypothetical protein
MNWTSKVRLLTRAVTFMFATMTSLVMTLGPTLLRHNGWHEGYFSSIEQLESEAD